MAKLERRLNEAEKAARATMKANATGMPWPAVNASAATMAHARGNHARLVELPHAMRVKSFVLQAVLRISAIRCARTSSRGASRRRYRSSSEGRSSRRITARARGSSRRAKQEQLRKSMMLEEAPVLVEPMRYTTVCECTRYGVCVSMRSEQHRAERMRREW